MLDVMTLILHSIEQSFSMKLFLHQQTITLIRSVDYPFSALFGIPEDFLYSNRYNFYSMGTLVLCNSSPVLRNCSISLVWPTNNMNEVTFMAVQFINVESFFSLRKFIGPKNPL